MVGLASAFDFGDEAEFDLVRRGCLIRLIYLTRLNYSRPNACLAGWMGGWLVDLATCPGDLGMGQAPQGRPLALEREGRQDVRGWGGMVRTGRKVRREGKVGWKGKGRGGREGREGKKGKKGNQG